MKKTIFLAFLATWGVWVFSNENRGQTQTVIEATETMRLHDEMDGKSPIPIVKCLDIEPQGQLLALGGDDHVVRLWNVREGKFVTQLREHRESIRGLAFSPDAARLVTVDQDGKIHVWNAQNGRLLRTLREPVRGTRQICFKPDGTHFAVCGYDKNVRVYDSATYKLLATLPAHDTNNEAIAYSHDGSLLAVGGRTGVIRVWRTSDTQHITVIEGDSRRVRALAFSPDDSLLAAAGEGPFIMLWEPQTGTLVRTFTERPGKTFSLTFCGNDVVASGESDNMIRLWNPATGKQTALLSGHTGTISTMIFEPKTQNLVTGSFDASIRFWSLPQKEMSILPVSTLYFAE
ncbi:MAG: WD40 repeat domain-containing protein [Planctomycetaceae bacterium]|jgi:WD40 repeat protein|nr:WD40 repeat domain-containing protein [Planctomycetaceae bacterium]